ncbi:MAG: ABC transporter ATP-binding protein [Solirubrobacteraceae bacterium]|nr:ABC transporter ATP-binding protein [Solirubrobacteraceae bacterium]
MPPARRQTSSDAQDAPRAAAPPTSLREIMRRHRAGLVGASLLAVLAAAAALAPYVGVYLVTDELIGDGTPDTGVFAPIAIGVAIALVVRGAASAASSHTAHRAAYAILADLRLALMDRIGRVPLGEIQRRGTAGLKQVLHDDVEQLEDAFAHGVPDIAAAAAVPTATLALFFVVDWRLALVTLASIALIAGMYALTVSIAERVTPMRVKAQIALATGVLTYLRGMRVVRGFQREDEGYDAVRALIRANQDAQDAALRDRGRWFVSGLVTALGITSLLLVAVGGTLHVSGHVDLSTLALFLLLGLGFANSLYGLVLAAATVVIRFRMAAGSVGKLLAAPVLEAPDAPRTPDAYDVAFEGVSFAYDDEPVLRDVGFAVPERGLVGVVGPSGAGKTTLARLITRFWDVDAGAVRIGGIDVRDVDPAELMRRVALVAQDDYVFDRSVLENIRVGRPDASDEEVRAAGTRARLDDDVARLPHGWDTVVGAGGALLSGGQRQRISIARALLKDAPLVVLDEATAWLDAENEAAARQAVAELAADRTVIVIAHRLPSVRDADRIVVLDGGRVAGVGGHDELLRDCRVYRTMWEAQERAGGWRIDASDAPPAPVSPVERATTPDPWTERARALVRPELGELPFLRQWRALMGSNLDTLLRRGLVRLLAESLVRGLPVVAVFLLLREAIVGEPTQGLIWALAGGTLLALLLRVLTNERANRVVFAAANQAKADVQLSLVERLRRVPLGFLERHDAGRISTVVNNDVFMLDFQNTPQQIAATTVQPLLASIALFVLDWRLALATLAGLPLFALLTRWANAAYRRAVAPLDAARVRAIGELLEHIRGAVVLRAHPGSGPAVAYRDAIHELRRRSDELSAKSSPATALTAVALELGTAVVIAVGAVLYVDGAIAADTLLLFLVLSLVLYQPLLELNALTSYRRNQQQLARRVGAIWDAPVLPEPDAPGVPADGAVELRDVTFRYATSDDDLDAAAGPPALERASLRAAPGTVTALVGPSGAGKSTICDLLARFWDVDSGAVLIGGVDVRELGSAAVQANVTTVYQEVQLFAGTVRANLVLGRPDATDAEIDEALRAASATDVVAALADGLDTVLDENGASLSGGQRQRLSIARALLKDAPVLILDEAAASVDPDTEAQIQRGIASLARGRTVIVVAHRLDTVREADQIVVVDEGRVVGSGTHDDLVRDAPVYRRLWAAHDPDAVAAG